MSLERFCRVAVALPVQGTYTYKIPEHLLDFIEAGQRVLVPFGKRRVTGYILEITDDSGLDQIKAKPVHDLLDEMPVFDKTRLELFNFAANYYIQPLGEVIKTGLPAGINRESRISWSITEQGIDAANSPGIAVKDRRVLLCLEPGKLYDSKKLRSRSNAASPVVLKRLADLGWVHKIDMLEDAITKAKFVNTYFVPENINPLQAMETLSRAPKQLEVFQFLIETGRADVKSTSMIIKNPGPALLALTKRGFIETDQVECYRDCEPVHFSSETKPITLNGQQQKAFDAINKKVKSKKFAPFLLHGVTGSGKTEVYLRLTKTALDSGRRALILVPEIALTPQLVSRFVKRFGSRIAVSHSGLSNSERYDQWRRMLRDQADLCVGTRSAIFSPLKNLGLVVVDEEHDTSYKQDTGVPYNGRDLALVLGKQVGCPVVLGSATPSLESYHWAKTGRYTLLQINDRATVGPLPKVEVVDLVKELAKRRKKPKKTDSQDDIGQDESIIKALPAANFAFSATLKKALKENLDKGRQAILFLNRRGYSTHSFCLECRRPIMCPNCEVSLTPHFDGKELHCHYCDFKMPSSTICEHCGGRNFFLAGLGTEQLEKAFLEMFPKAKVARLDSDTTARKGSLEKILVNFGKRKYDVLVGTQIVTKGHDFPGVTLVGVLCADSSMYMPDFRSAERTFQLLSQVAGRAGRGKEKGRVIIQTFNPDHYSITTACKHDYRGFFDIENENRAGPVYPPYTRLALMRSKSKSKEESRSFLLMVANSLRQSVREEKLENVKILGPTQSAVSRIQGFHRHKLLIKTPSPAVLNSVMRQAIVLATKWKHADIEWRIDIDPQSIL